MLDRAKTAGEDLLPPAALLCGLRQLRERVSIRQWLGEFVAFCEPIEPDDWPGVAMAPVLAGLGFLVLGFFMFWLCIEPPDIVLPVAAAGEAMLPPDMEPELVGVDGPDIVPPVWAKAVPVRAVTAKVMIAKAAVRVVKVFMVFPLR